MMVGRLWGRNRQKDIQPGNDAQRRAVFARMDEDGAASGSSGGGNKPAMPEAHSAPKPHAEHTGIVRRAIEQGVTNIGQLSKSDKSELDKAVKRGWLTRTQDFNFPSAPPKWVVNFEYQQELIDAGILETTKEVRELWSERNRQAAFVGGEFANVGGVTVNSNTPDFIVTKQADGRHRWVLISSSAYEDRDGEIVSQKALQADVDRADADGDFGPLRWWHIPGAEIGDCDFNMLHGRLLYESGTFRDERMAKAVKEHAAELGASIGFQHPIGQPDADGVFHAIRRFERSLLPREKASNPFTAVSFVEKEAQMTSIEDKLKAFGKVLNGDAEMVAQVLAIGATKEAEAALAGTRHKEKKECEPGYHWDEATQACVKDKQDDAPPPPADEKKEYVGDMDPAALKAMIGDAVTGQMTTLKAELQTALDAQTATKAQHDEATAVALKAYETKLDGIAASATAAGEAATQALAGVKELKGELPRALGERLKGWRASEKGDEPPAELKEQEPAPDPMEKHWKAIQATAGIHQPAA